MRLIDRISSLFDIVFPLYFYQLKPKMAYVVDSLFVVTPTQNFSMNVLHMVTIKSGALSQQRLIMYTMNGITAKY